jgi:hypothetical protein
MSIEITEAMVDRAVETLRPMVPNTGDVLWEYEDNNYETGDAEMRPITLRDVARAALNAALTSEEPA